MSLHWPSGLDAARFLERHWQRRPRLMRAAFDPADFLLPDAHQLAGLALEEGVESRLVSHRGFSQWQLERGPFEAARLSALPPRDWTLLVQDVDSHLPASGALFELVDFLPRWRREDLMISVAAPGGSVGPHVDQYDVFLAQVSGRREWRIGGRGDDIALTADAPLPLLARFRTRHCWELAPGDLLYLPPGVPHFGTGVATDALCVTASLGFRAPDAADVAALLLETRFGERAAPRYGDAGLGLDEADGEIGERVLARLERLLASVPDPRGTLATAMGRLMTETKPWLTPRARARAPGAARLESRLAEARTLHLAPGCRAAFSRAGRAPQLFLNGQAWLLPAGALPVARALSRGRAVNSALLPPGPARVAVLELLRELYREGLLEWGDRAS